MHARPLLLESRRTLAMFAGVWCISFAAQAAPPDFAQLALAKGDTGGLPFAVIDKAKATLTLYDKSGRLLGVSPVLVGSAEGDDSIDGIGSKPLSQIAPHERTTPAGRFLSEPGQNAKGESIVWIDYDSAVSMHRLRPSSPSEKRSDRLATPSPLDNRITYGCVNVPAAFYDKVVWPLLGKSHGVVYVLPELKPAHTRFSFLN